MLSKFLHSLHKNFDDDPQPLLYQAWMQTGKVGRRTCNSSLQEANLAELDHLVVACRIIRGEDKPHCSQIVLTSRLWFLLAP